MSVLVVGLSHKTAPVELRERFALSGEVADAATTGLAERPGIHEACILSTCNRVEFMLRSDIAEQAETELLTYLDEAHVAPVREAEPHLYRHADRAAVRHIFRVASSLDSMVIGEPQILGQVKQAYNAAKRTGSIRGPLDHLFTAAFRVARRVRNETGIGQHAVSISYVAVELARKIFGDLNGLSVLLIGAGKMSEAAARHIHSAGAKELIVTNRTYERATELAQTYNASPAPFENLFELLTKVDIVISSTGAPEFVLSKEMLRRVTSARRGKPIFLVDIAVPRDIDPEINKLDDTFVYDIDDLQQVANANLGERRKEAGLAEKIVEEEVDKVMQRIRTVQVAPTIVQLQKQLEQVRTGQLERFKGKLSGLTPEQQAAVDALTRGMMNKIAHPPITEMKRTSDRPDGPSFVQAVRKAFRLGGG